MSTEADLITTAPIWLGANASAWFPIYNNRFQWDHWANISVFPLPNPSPDPSALSSPVKITLAEVDWESDEWNNRVAWILVKNLNPNYAVAFQVTVALMPNQ
jgi:hypothetical protein